MWHSRHEIDVVGSATSGWSALPLNQWLLRQLSYWFWSCTQPTPLIVSSMNCLWQAPQNSGVFWRSRVHASLCARGSDRMRKSDTNLPAALSLPSKSTRCCGSITYAALPFTSVSTIEWHTTHESASSAPGEVRSSS